MEKIKVCEPRENKFSPEQRMLFTSLANGELKKSSQYPEGRIEPELILTHGSNLVAQGQYKWSGNCCHLQYDVLSDYLIAKKILGINSLIIKPSSNLCNQILKHLGANIIPGEIPSDSAQVCIPSQEGEFISVQNPWRHGGHHHSFISNLIKENLSNLITNTEQTRNIIIYRRVRSRVFNRNIHNILEFRQEISEKYGQEFEIVDIEMLDLAGQINLFNSAKTIISPHGSGLVWLNFCRPNTKCIEIFNSFFVNRETYPRYDFWISANQNNVNYTPLFVEDCVGDPEDPYELNLRVNVDHINRILNGNI